MTELGTTIVTRDNFTIAETDKYMAEHTAEHPVNTIRHAREPSGPDNQFVITENMDVLYSHA
ncbi:MAG: lytic murein transglycosylase, partial [Gemmatimonadota bacterium]